MMGSWMKICMHLFDPQASSFLNTIGLWARFALSGMVTICFWWRETFNVWEVAIFMTILLSTGIGETFWYKRYGGALLGKSHNGMIISSKVRRKDLCYAGECTLRDEESRYDTSVTR